MFSSKDKKTRLVERRLERRIDAAASAPVNAVDVVGLSEAVDDRVSGLLVAGSNITLTYNDPANTLTIASTASGGGSPWDFDDGSPSTTYGVGTIDLEGGVV